MMPIARFLAGLVAIVLGYVVVPFLAIEVMFRAWNDVSILETTNFRKKLNQIDLSDAVAYDERLGWVFRPHRTFVTRSPGGDIENRTFEHGVLRTKVDQQSAFRGGALVVGSSFSAGSEVADPQSWPAQFSAITGIPVNNASVGGYALDQVVLRTESLLDALDPEIVILDLMLTTYQWMGYSSLSRAKPYFQVRDGKLVDGNNPVPRTEIPFVAEPWWKELAGYSYVIDRVMRASNLAGWQAVQRGPITRVATHPTDVACLLLQRLKHRLDARGTRAFLVHLPGGAEAAQTGEMSPLMVPVGTCARQMGYGFLSTQPALHAALRSNPQSTQGPYTLNQGQYGHLSPTGNEIVAKLVAAALASATNEKRATDWAFDAGIPGDGQNRLGDPLSTLLSSNPVATVSAPGSADGSEAHVSAIGPSGEHYVVSREFTLEEGSFVLSVEASAVRGGVFRLWLTDPAGMGIYGDFDLTKAFAESGTNRSTGVTDLRIGIDPVAEKWSRTWISAKLSAGKYRLMLHMGQGSAGKLGFLPNGETIGLRRLRLEKGQRPSSVE